MVAQSDTSVAHVLGRLGSLADETRARILLLLEANELTVGEICQIVQLPQSTVSRHLGILSGEGWLAVRSEGTSRHYRWSSTPEPGAEPLWRAVRDQISDCPVAVEDRARAASVLEARAERSAAFFSSEAGRWDHLRQELFGARADLQLLTGLLDGEDVGDLGCGTGHLSRLIAPFARRVFAVDRSPEMLGLARERLDGFANAEVRRGDLRKLPLEDASLDVAILALVLHYVVDLERAFSELHRVLRPSGRALVLDMMTHEHASFGEEMGHAWLGFNPQALSARLASAGFGPARISVLPPDATARGPSLFTLTALRS